jgi:RNA polymerase sigma-70 factor (ECF subfamily)
LRLLGGLTTAEVAAAFIVAETTMAKRLVRAKHKITVARIPYRVPTRPDLADRLRAVLAVLYLIYNAGCSGPAGAGLRAEAIRLARIVSALLPEEPECSGLLSLLLLSESRQPARYRADGSLVLLADQDRTRWDRDLIAEGHALLRACLQRDRPGVYQLQAVINAVHAQADSVQMTDWAQIVRHYDHLLALSPSPVVALNRAIAVGELRGPAPALALVEDLDDTLHGYYLFHATRADLLRRLARDAEAVQAYARAAALAPSSAERSFLEARVAQMCADGSGIAGGQVREAGLPRNR